MYLTGEAAQLDLSASAASAGHRHFALRMSAFTQSLRYSIAGSSEYSGRYSPEHIKVDRPLDQSSRWSSVGAREREGPSSGRGWLLLRLDEPAILGERLA